MSLTSNQVCMDNMDSASDQHHQWLQATMHEDALMDSSSSPSGADMLGPSQILLSERRLRPPQDLALKCPRCDSTHTKFCYYNNYSLSQPRYFCKTCRRYWTKGGTLRNIPVGGGFRKNRKSSSNKKLASNEQLSVSSINNQNTSLNMIMMPLPSANPSDRQLSFPLLQLPNLLTSSGNYTESILFNKSIPMHDNNCPSNDGLIIRPTDHPKQHEVAMNHMISKTNTYGGYFSTQFVEEGGYDDMQNVRYANNDYIGLSNYLDNNNNNNNYSNSAAQSQLVEYSGLHEYQPNNIQIIHREVKPSPNILALEWQQKTAGYPDANSNSKQDSSFCYDMSRSWWGMSSNTAGNTYHHHPATTHN